jgi:cell division protein ZapA
MVPIHLSLLGRSYTLLCEPGEEAQVRRLHELINSRAEALSRQVGNASDPRILMLLLLQFAEAQGESEQRIKALEAELNTARHAPLPSDDADGTQTAHEAASRIALYDEMTRELNALADELEAALARGLDAVPAKDE